MVEQPDPDFPLEPAVPVEWKAALRDMEDRKFLLSQKHQEQQWRAFREGAHPKLREFEKKFVRRMARFGVPMFCHVMVRSVAQQRREFEEGDSKNDGSRPYPHRGFAFDLIHGTKGWNLSPKGWLLIGHVGKEVAASMSFKVTWGGDWRRKPTDEVGWDPAHWECKEWRQMYDAYPFASFPS